MTKLVLIKAAAGALHGSFRRLGRTFTTTGTIVNPADFTKEEWDILVAEKMLHIGPAPDTALGGASGEVDDDALRALVKEALGKLDPAEFGEGGVPSADAVRRVLPPKTKGVTASLVTEIWASLQPPPAA